MRFHLCIVLLISLMLVSVQSGYCSNIITVATEETPDTSLFNHCLDSIKKYVYLDSRKIEPFMLLCQEILNSDHELTDRHLMEFVIQSIYNEFNNTDNLRIAEMMMESRYLLEKESVTKSQIGQFNYLEGYNKMLLGDFESAQRNFYGMLEKARIERDTSLLLQSLGSLGTLFTKSKEYDDAEKCLKEYVDIAPNDRPSIILNGYVELVWLYILKEDYESAERFNNEALVFADSVGSKDLKINILLNSCRIKTKTNDYKLAYQAYNEAKNIATQINNEYYLNNCKAVYAELLLKKENYTEARSLYNEMLRFEKAGANGLKSLMDLYEKLSEIEQQLGEYESSLKYLQLQNALSDSLEYDKQKQQSAYLKIKFDAKQKEKENIELNAEISANQSQRKFLISLIVAGFFGTIFLTFAFLQKRNFNKRLKEDVASRTLELETVNQELRDINKIFSHDLKEPLRSIVGFSTLAKKEFESGDAAQVDQYLDYVNKSGLQMFQLISNVSEFQSIDYGSQNEKVKVDCNLIINKIKQANRSLIEERNVKIKSEKLPELYGYESMIFLVFKNLIENAIKFNESNQPLITINSKVGDDFYHFYVMDNGIGIAQKFHQTIFNMFDRLHDRGKYEGTGLGLSITKKLLTKMGGSIKVESSNLGEGTTFKVSIPISQFDK